ncbi:hypothetical protein F4814DRAFT_460208 [Daldinia grandis]|nr:hypothetical protein F4814DRAFT_460208 [Daldinia grandis]
MEDSHRYRVDYSENVAPKYPAGNHDGIEVVPSDSPFYAHPIYTAPPAEGGEEWPSVPVSAVTAPEEEEKRRVLGLTVPLFWTVVLVIIVVLAAGIGGGIGGGLTAQQKSNISVSRFVALELYHIPSLNKPKKRYDKPAPSILSINLAGFCNNNNNTNSTGQRSPPLRWRMSPNQRTTVYTYNSAYYANLGNGTGVGGGFCVAVTIVKVDAGFCYLKNGTSTNNTRGHPETYSSAVLLTKIDMVGS